MAKSDVGVALYKWHKGAKKAEKAAADQAKKLADDAASRMARAQEQGHTVARGENWYHGSAKEGYVDSTDITEFDASKAGDRWRADDEGFFLTSDPDEAGYYARSDLDYRDPGAGNGAIYPLSHNMKSPLVIDDEFLKTQGMVPIGQTEDTVSFWDNYQSLIKDWTKEAGADGAILVDGTTGRKMAWVKDPSNIRSVNAMFDHAKKDSAPLLAGLGGAAVVGGAATGSQEAEAGTVSALTTLPDMVKALRKRGVMPVDGPNYRQRDLVERIHATMGDNQTIGEQLENTDFIKRMYDQYVQGKGGAVAGAAALGAGGSGEAEAGPLKVLSHIDEAGNKVYKTVIEAYHGSPHKFDKFSMDQIGTGEGAQAYGHGLYFADSEDVARGYRDDLALSRGTPDEVFENYEVGKGAGSNQWGLYDKDTGFQDTDFSFPTEAEAQAFLDSSAKQGALYRTHLDVDPDTLLDWDKPLGAERAQELKRAFGDVQVADTGNGYAVTLIGPDGSGRIDYSTLAATPKDAMGNFNRNLEMMRGENIYRQVSRMLGDDATASRALNEAGIPGIRYKDGMSRGQGTEPYWPVVRKSDGVTVQQVTDPEKAKALLDSGDFQLGEKVDPGTYNYVMFDDTPVSIKERGIADPALLAGVAAGTAGAIQVGQPTPVEQMPIDDIYPSAAEFYTVRAGKQQFWDDQKAKVKALATTAATNTIDFGMSTFGDLMQNPMNAYIASRIPDYLDASTKPMQGVSGLVTLAATGDPQKAASVARMPQEQIAQMAGRNVTDDLLSRGRDKVAPYAGAVTDAAINATGL